MTARPVLAVVNPNTDAAVTAIMARIVAETIGDSLRVEGLTVTVGPPLITNEEDLARAADEVVREGEAAAAAGAVAVLVAAFGDPGVETLSRRVAVPVVGIAQAAIAEAATGRRRFSIVTTTPMLERSIAATVHHHGHASLLASVRVTPGDADATMADPDRLARALLAACRLAVVEDGAEAVVIGGGPLALAARAIAGDVGVPLIEPIPAGARLAARRAAGN